MQNQNTEKDIFKNIEYNSKDLSVENDGFSTEEHVTLDIGKCVGIAFHNFSTLPLQNVNLSVETTQGKPILLPVDIRDYQKSNAPGIDAYKRVSFQTNGKVNVKLSSSEALRSGFKGQVVFVIKTDE
ncbi:hypothetical protein EZY14_009110 [Kordia sp. TARA_039_SRF]|nr:hypothetical protein EZY14_009110 [Kordia sp. TARA_039_SRF]